MRPGSLRAVLAAAEVSPEQPGAPSNELDGAVRLAKELVQTWLETLSQEPRVEAVQELTKFVVLYRGKVDHTSRGEGVSQ